jgi:hypothetical protein
VNQWEPQEVVVPPPRPWRRLVVLVLLLVTTGWALWLIRGWMRSMQAPPALATAEQVRSDVTAAGDSLDVIVTWRFSNTGRRPDSVRVEVGLEGAEERVGLHPGGWKTDTLRVAGPAPGETAMGHSCVSGVHGSRLSRESCTPWQFVRPAAERAAPKEARPDSATKKPARTAHESTKQILRIVVRPTGRQVDPDVGSKCAKWQRENPERSVWIEVNETAVPQCMGPNGKPTVAQFCAFAVTNDGQRVKTTNSTNNPYCDELFRAWLRERYS